MLKYPVIYKRNRSFQIIISLTFFIISIIWLVLFYENSQILEISIIAFVALVFLISTIFNFILIIEDTYEIDEKAIYCRSRFLPKTVVDFNNVVSADYSSDKKILIINYNLPEYNIMPFLEDVEKPESKVGMWQLYINKKDVNKPLGEIKFVINNILLSKSKPKTPDADF